jgi:hypothetical protein
MLLEGAMDRRHFLQSTTGAVLGSAILPLTSSAMRAVPPGGAEITAQPAAAVKSPWINTDPTRIGWCILRDLDVTADPRAVIDSVVKANINCLVLNAGGSIAFYPSTVPFHEHSPSLKGRDFFGLVAAAARQRHIRMGARFDFSRQSKAALDAHPEWFFRRADGSPPADATGCFAPCLNSGFYQTQGVRIISEVMDRYKPELVFINAFSHNMVAPAAGVAARVDNTICHCENCRAGYLKKYGTPLSASAGAMYGAFLQEASDAASSAIADALRGKWPGTLYINANNDHSDGHHSEARTAGSRQVWAYSSSESVDRQRTSYPERVGLNIAVGYSANTSRLVILPQEEMKVHLYQAGAHGSPLAYAFTGTPLTQYDQRELDALAKVYGWHAANADLYSLQVNQARVLLLCEPETAPRRRNPLPDQTNRGIYRMLTEAHIPVAVSENPRSMQNASQHYDLVIVTEGALTDGVKAYVENGGRALFINQAPPFGMPSPVREVSDSRTGYVEIRDPRAFPSLGGIRYLSCSGSYSLASGAGPGASQMAKFFVYPDEQGAPLTFVAPMVEQPAEFAFRDLQQTQVPALLTRDVGKGRIAFVPWDLGGFYTRGSLPIHANLFTDIVDALLPNRRQIRSSAHPSIEMVLMSQPDKRRAILHLINGSGQSSSAYFEPIPFHAIEIDLMGSFSTAKARVAGADLKIVARQGRTVLTLPVLNGYEAIVLT